MDATAAMVEALLKSDCQEKWSIFLNALGKGMFAFIQCSNVFLSHSLMHYVAFLTFAVFRYLNGGAYLLFWNREACSISAQNSCQGQGRYLIPTLWEYFRSNSKLICLQQSFQIYKTLHNLWTSTTNHFNQFHVSFKWDSCQCKVLPFKNTQDVNPNKDLKIRPLGKREGMCDSKMKDKSAYDVCTALWAVNDAFFKVS